MRQTILTPEQLGKLSGIESPVLRQRFALYYQLPQDVRELIFAEDSVEKIRAVVVDKNNLKDEDRKRVAWIVGLVLLGEMPIKNIVRELADALNIDNEKSSALAQDINQVIFQPVRESLMEVHDIKNESSIGDRGSGLENKKIISNRTTNKPQPVSIEDLEGMSKPQAPLDQHVITSELEDEAEERRERLLNKLQQDSGEGKTIDLSSKTLPKKKNIQQSPQKPPKAIATAWDGRTIDLTKIPPRRKSTRKKYKRIKVHEA